MLCRVVSFYRRAFLRSSICLRISSSCFNYDGDISSGFAAGRFAAVVPFAGTLPAAATGLAGTLLAVAAVLAGALLAATGFAGALA